MNSIELDTKAEIAQLVKRIIRMTINDAQNRRARGMEMATLEVLAERLGQRLDQRYTFTVVVEQLEKRNFRCECGETFEAGLPFEAPSGEFAKALDALRCPKCKGASLYLVTNG